MWSLRPDVTGVPADGDGGEVGVAEAQVVGGEGDPARRRPRRHPHAHGARRPLVGLGRPVAVPAVTVAAVPVAAVAHMRASLGVEESRDLLQ